MTKYSDFPVSHLLLGSPRRLLLLVTGNIANALLDLFDRHLDAAVSALDEARFVEIGTTDLVVHEDR